jgi:transcriptional regulator with XRE-family HTH domain
MVTEELGAWLRREREARSWTRAEMARRLIKAARASGDTTMPSSGNICHNIYRWERGVITPGERYKLYYCQAFGISCSGLAIWHRCRKMRAWPASHPFTGSSTHQCHRVLCTLIPG